MRKRAILVGCNYPGSPHELKGCANDVVSIRALLYDLFDYRPEDVSILQDTDPQTLQPTGANIKAELNRLVSITAPGDVLFFHYSGHGTQVPSDDADEPDKLDEAIVPTDMNLILDDDLRVITRKIPRGARFTMLSDCCHSGSMLDHKPRHLTKDTSRHLPAGSIPKVNQAPWRSKSLPYEALLAQLSQAVGAQVGQGNLRYSLAQAFGEDASLKAQAYLGMLGEVFKEEVAANGGKLPPLGVKTLVRLAGRLWVKRKIFHGKQKLGGLFGIQGKKGKTNTFHPKPNPLPTSHADPHAAYLQYTDISKIMGLHLPEDRRPHESTYASLKPYYQTDEDGVSKYHKIMAAAGYYVHPSKLNPRASPFPNPSTSAASSQQPNGGDRLAESAAGRNPSSSHTMVQQEQTGTAAAAAASSSSQSAPEQQGRAGTSLNPNAAPYYPDVGLSPDPSSYPPGSPYQQQQAGRQGVASPVQPLQGIPNPVSQRTSQQPNPRVSGHRHHLAEKLHLPMDWHMDVLAGRAPATFSPLGDQATSGYFPPILTPDSAMHTSEYMAEATQPSRVSPSPKRYTQHALKVSAQALGHDPYTQGSQPQPPQQQAYAQPPQGFQAAGHPGFPYPSYGGNGYANPSQTPTMSGHQPQSPSVVVYPGQNPGVASYLGQHPSQGWGYPSQQQGYPMQGAGYPSHRPGYPMQGPGYPSQQPGYPMQGPGYTSQQQGYPMQGPGHPSQQQGSPYQGAGFTITPLHRPGQGTGAAAHPHQRPQHVAPYPPQTPGFAASAYGPQSPGGGAHSPQGGKIAAVYPGQNQTPGLSANPSQSSLVSSQQGQGLGGGPYPSQSGLFAFQQGQSMEGSAAYPTQQPTPAAPSGQGGLGLPQHGQGSNAAGAGALGGFSAESLLGSNGKPTISGRPGSKPHKLCQLDEQVGVLISGCADNETSADAQDPAQPGRACGAMTNALVTVVRDHYEQYPSTPLTNK
ncbi:hypothetical protein ABBQ38_007622 [Trebouxia sp. C0009 RCD-2024]